MSESTIRVFVNAGGVDIPVGGSALDAVRASSGDLARDVEAGKRLITDSRGLPIDPSTAMNAGSILRLIANRAGTRGAADAEADA